MRIASVHVQNFRSHRDFLCTFSPEVTLITGVNGSGKTSLLEAIYIALQGASFKGLDKDILTKDQPWWRITTTAETEVNRIITYNSEKVTSRKQFTIDDKVTTRIPQKYKHPVVLFEPEDLRLLHGSPARRRHFIDRFITQLNPLYTTAIRKYERALTQRNKLLKRTPVSKEELFAWDIALAEHGSYIIEQRIAFIERINRDIANLYQSLSHTTDEIAIHYSHTRVGNIQQKLLIELQSAHEKDIYLGNTSIGPHRHDVLFVLNNSPALSTASRGEARTIVLALKFLEVAIIEAITEKKPIILLDDVFSELDANRQKLLTSHLKGYQIIITSATSHAGDEIYSIILP